MTDPYKGQKTMEVFDQLRKDLGHIETVVQRITNEIRLHMDNFESRISELEEKVTALSEGDKHPSAGRPVEHAEPHSESADRWPSVVSIDKDGETDCAYYGKGQEPRHSTDSNPPQAQSESEKSVDTAEDIPPLFNRMKQFDDEKTKCELRSWDIYMFTGQAIALVKRYEKRMKEYGEKRYAAGFKEGRLPTADEVRGILKPSEAEERGADEERMKAWGDERYAAGFKEGRLSTAERYAKVSNAETYRRSYSRGADEERERIAENLEKLILGFKPDRGDHGYSTLYEELRLFIDKRLREHMFKGRRQQ